MGLLYLYLYSLFNGCKVEERKFNNFVLYHDGGGGD